MAWNEPGNNDNDPWNPDKNRGNNGRPDDDKGNDPNGNDPWGRSSGGKNQSPPDLDEAFRKLMDMLGVKKSRRGGSGGGSGGFSGKMGGWFIGLIFILIAAVWAASGVYQVDQQERAVVLRLGKYYATVQPGLHWNPPLVDEVLKENVTKVRSHDHKALMLTVDDAIVEVGVSVQYSVENPKDFLLNVRDPEESLAQATESALRHVVGSSEMDQILTEGRELLASEVKERLQGYMNDYGTGLLISKVNVENTQAPSQVQEAFDDVIKAKEDELRVRNEAESYANGIIPEARGKAQRIREEAEAYRSEVVARASGQADRFDRLYQEYVKAPEVTRRRLYIETMESVYKNANKVVVDTEGGNNMMYLPLDQLMKQGAGAGKVDVQSLDSDSIGVLTNQVLDEIRRRQGTSIRREGRN